MEQDPTAIEPNDVEAPPEFEPQPGLQPGQTGEIVEREPDLISEAEVLESEVRVEHNGEADDGDDEVNDVDEVR